MPVEGALTCSLLLLLTGWELTAAPSESQLTLNLPAPCLALENRACHACHVIICAACPHTHVVLLQVLLGQVLEVPVNAGTLIVLTVVVGKPDPRQPSHKASPLAQVGVSSHGDLGLVAGHLDVVTEHAGLAVHLDLVRQELLKGGYKQHEQHIHFLRNPLIAWPPCCILALLSTHAW